MANDECPLGRENKEAIGNLERNQQRIEGRVNDVWKTIDDLRSRVSVIMGAALISAFGIIVTLVLKLVEMKNGS